MIKLNPSENLKLTLEIRQYVREMPRGYDTRTCELCRKRREIVKFSQKKENICNECIHSYFNLDIYGDKPTHKEQMIMMQEGKMEAIRNKWLYA